MLFLNNNLSFNTCRPTLCFLNNYKDISRGSGKSCLIFRDSTPIAACTLPSQHSCFGVPLKSQHRCDFLTLHARGSRWSQVQHYQNFIELINICLFTSIDELYFITPDILLASPKNVKIAVKNLFGEKTWHEIGRLYSLRR